MNLETPPTEDETALIFAYLEQVQRDPDSPPPIGLDPAFAELLRHVARTASTQRLSETAKAEIWHKVRFQAALPPNSDFSSNGRHPPMLDQTFATPRKRAWREQRFLTGFATLLAIALFALAARQFFASSRGVGNGAAAPSMIPSPTSQSGMPFAPAYSYLARQPPRSVVWSPDGTQFAAIEGAQDEQIALRDVTNGRLALLIGHSGRVNQIAWSPDGKMLASAGEDHSLRVWSAKGQLITIFGRHANRVDSVAWSPDGALLASASSLDGTVRLSSPTGEFVRTLQFSPTSADGATRLFWSPDGKNLGILYSDSVVDIWTRDGKIAFSSNRQTMLVNGFTWSPDGQQFALGTVSRGLLVYTAQGKLVSETGIASDNASASDALSYPHWSSDGKYITVADFMNRLHIASGLTSGQIILTQRLGMSVSDITISPDSSLIAVGLTDGSSARIDVMDRQLKVQTSFTAQGIVQGGVNVAWSPDGERLIGVFGGQGAQVFTVTPSIRAAALQITAVSVAADPAMLYQATFVPTMVPTLAPAQSGVVLPLKMGETVQGELRAGQREQGYSFTADADGRLLILLQSDDFAVTAYPQVTCEGSGGNGSGGGGSVTGGSPLIKAQLVAVCKGGAVQLVVSSISGTEAGRFTLTVYPLRTESITPGEVVAGTIDANTPYHYYRLSGAMGDTFTAQFTSANGNRIALAVDEPNQPLKTASEATSRVVLRENGDVGVLIAPATRDGSGAFTLKIDTDAAPLLIDQAQRIDLTAKEPLRAFRIKGSAQPVLLTLKGLSGTSGAVVTVRQTGLAFRTPPLLATPNTVQLVLPVTPIASLEIDSRSDLSYKLALEPDAEYIVFVELRGGPDDAFSLEIGASSAVGQ